MTEQQPCPHCHGDGIIWDEASPEGTVNGCSCDAGKALAALAARSAQEGKMNPNSETPAPERIWVDGVEYVRADLLAEMERQRDEAKSDKDQAYEERNRLVALLASIYPSGIAKTAIEGWNDEWHQCVYIDFPWGQASWHYHDSQAYLFNKLPSYNGAWDGHTTEEKYAAIGRAATAIRALAEGE